MVYEKLKNLIIEQMGCEEDEITLETRFIDDLEMDSLDIAELIMSVEDEFDFSLPDDEAIKISTVGEAVEYIQEHM
jgi:acyl carrier protein